MAELGYDEMTPEEWMTTYLNWTEWKTEMHDVCWS
jgi:hypothetical protein